MNAAGLVPPSPVARFADDPSAAASNGAMTWVVLLGATCSIGTQALSVIADYPDRVQVTRLAAAGGRIELLARQTLRYRPHVVALATLEAATEFRSMCTAPAQAAPPPPAPRALLTSVASRRRP
jgi:hypothetical protein